MRMRIYACLGLLVLNTGPNRALAKDADALVYLTVDADAAATVALQVGGRVHFADSNGSATVVAVPEGSLDAVTAVFHDSFHRCGGYRLYASRAGARGALSQPRVFDSHAMDSVARAVDSPELVDAVVAPVSATRLADTVSTLSESFQNRYFRTPGGVRSAQWLRDEWTQIAAGRADVRVELVMHEGWPQPSVKATIAGTDSPEQMVILGAHLDSTGRARSVLELFAPGADDDASGVAVVTEVLRAAMDSNYRPASSVVLYAYAAEEVGLRGSQEIAQKLAAAQAHVLGVLQFDMVLMQGADNFDIALTDDYTDASLTQFVAEIIETHLDLSWTTTTCGYACSDHASWTEAGFPTAYPFEATETNQAIHSPGDLLGRVGNSPEHAAKFARLGAAFVAELAEGDTNGQRDPNLSGPERPTPSVVREEHSVETDAEKRHGPYPVVPGTELLVGTTSTFGDADLYVSFDAEPTSEGHDCKSAGPSSNELCFLRVPEGAKVLHVLVNGYEATDYSLELEYVPGELSPTEPEAGEPEPTSGGCRSGAGNEPVLGLCLIILIAALRRRETIAKRR